MYVLAELASNITAIQQKLPVDKLFIYETLSILDWKPDLNRQTTL